VLAVTFPSQRLKKSTERKKEKGGKHVNPLAASRTGRRGGGEGREKASLKKEKTRNAFGQERRGKKRGSSLVGLREK